MGWPGWTGWGWAKDDEDETEVDNAGRGKAGSRPSGGATNNATIDTSPTSLKSLIGRLGYNVQQLEQMLDYNDEDDSFKS